MPVKIACVAAGLVATIVLTVLAAAARTSLSSWLFMPLTMLVLSGCVAGVHWWAAGEYRGTAFYGLSEQRKTRLLWATTIAAAAHATWIAAFLLAAPPVWSGVWALWVLVPLALSGVEALVAVAWDHRIRAVPEPEPTPNLPEVVVHEAKVVPPPHTPDQQFREALALMDRDYIEVPDWRELDYGIPLPEGIEVLGFVFVTRLASIARVRMAAEREDRKTGSTAKASIKPLTSADAEDVAVAWSEVTGIPMMSDWVHVTRERLAGITTVTVLLADTQQIAFPYPLHRTSRGKHALVGMQVDARPVEYNLRQHLALVGKSGSGKSAALNVLLAEMLLPETEGGPIPDVVVGGVRKVYDLVGQWFDPFLTPDLTGLPLPFRAVNGFRDTLDRLVWMMDEATRRQGLPHSDRAGLPDVYLVVDEIGTFLNHPGTVRWRGRVYTVSGLYAEGRTLLRSAGMFLVDLAQLWANSMYGEAAGTIKKNAPALMLMQSTDGDERGDMFGAGGAALGHHYLPGQFWLRDGAAPIAGRTFYLQELDARMQRLHDGPSIADVAVARARLRAERGDFSTGHMTPQLRDYLRGVGEHAPVEEPEQPSVADRTRQFLAELEAPRPAAEQVVVPEPGPVKPPTWAEQIVGVVQAADRPLAPQEIRAALPGLSEDMLFKKLRELKTRGHLAQPAEGVYAKA